MIYGKTCPKCGFPMNEIRYTSKTDAYQCLDCGYIEEFNKTDNTNLIICIILILVIMGFLL